MNPTALLYATSPEVVIALTALAVLLVDTLALQSWPAKTRSTALAVLVSIGVVSALALLAQHFVAAGGGELYRDDFGVFVEDPLTLSWRALVMVLALGCAWLVADYRSTPHEGELHALLLFAALGASVLVATENMIVFLVSVELLSVCLYAATGMHKGVLRSAEGGLRYFAVGALSSAFLMFGLSYVVGLANTTSIQGIAAAAPALMERGSSSALMFLGLMFVLVGLGFKIALVPFHAWAPDAYQGAPTPVTAFIATVSKVASFIIAAKIVVVAFAPMAGAALYRSVSPDESGFQFASGWKLVLATFACASMIWGNAAAVAQKNAKRLLAYSSVAHGGAMVIALVAADDASVTALLYYVVAYSFSALGAFGVVAALTRAAKGDDLVDLDGMVTRAPGLSLALLVCVLSLAGIPPLAGFFGKFAVFAAALKSDASGLGLFWLVVVALATSAIALYYYLVLLSHVFVKRARESAPAETGLGSRLVCYVAAVLVLVVGVAPDVWMSFFQGALAGWR